MEKNILDVVLGDKIRPFKEDVINEYNKQVYEVLTDIKEIKRGVLASHFIKIKLKEILTDEISEFTFNKNLTVFVEE